MKSSRTEVTGTKSKESRPPCPKCGTPPVRDGVLKIVSKGGEWFCKECGTYFTKFRRRNPVGFHPTCPFCGESDKVKSSGVPRYFCRRCNKTFVVTVPNPELKHLTQHLKIHSDSIVVTGDVHLPFHCPDTLAKMIEFAGYFGSRDIVIVGDLMELDVFKRFLDIHPDIKRAGGWEYEKQKTREFFELIDQYFDRVYILLGNHELRMWKKLQAAGSQTDVLEIVLSDKWEEKVKVSVYPFAWINDSWIVVHPKSYSRIQSRNPYFLASKYLIELVARGKSPNGVYGLIDFHSHLGGEGTDISGKFQVANGMGLFDPKLSEWHVKQVDTFPEWRKGFMILHRNYLYRFPAEHTDWDFWRGLFRGKV